jgi:hypothetical protein
MLNKLFNKKLNYLFLSTAALSLNTLADHNDIYQLGDVFITSTGI